MSSSLVRIILLRSLALSPLGFAIAGRPRRSSPDNKLSPQESDSLLPPCELLCPSRPIPI